MHASAARRVAVAALLLLAGLAAPGDGPQAQEAGTAGEAAYGDYLQGLHLFHSGEYEAALPYFVRAKDEAAARAGYGSGEHATALNNLGELYRRMGRLDEAETLLLEALAIEEQRLGPTDRNLAKPLNNLALVQRVQGRYDEAEANLKRSLRLLEDSLGRRHPDVAGSLNNLARLYESTGQPDRARPLLERALMIAVDTLGDAHPTTKRVAVNLERVKGQIAETGAPMAVAAEGESAAVATASADGQSVPPAASLVLPPADADLPEPAAGAAPSPPLAASAASGDAAAGAGPIDAMPTARPSVAIAAATPAANVEAAAIEPKAVEAAEEASLGSSSDVAALGDANGAMDAVALLPRARPEGWRWPLLPPNAYALHLASVRSPISATTEWQRLAQLFELPPSIHQLEPQRVEREDEGVFYRVMGGPFATIEDALAVCRPIRASGDYCGIIGNDD